MVRAFRSSIELLHGSQYTLQSALSKWMGRSRVELFKSKILLRICCRQLSTLWNSTWLLIS